MPAVGSLYSKQPFMEELAEERMRYVLVVKEEDHKLLMVWVNEQRQLKEVSRLEVKDKKGCLHIYEWINEVPLNGNKKTLWVSYFEYWLVVGGKDTYHNSWVTDFSLSEGNVAKLVRIGRCRWKIENETFYTLKNQGYHIKHNFGHGEKHLPINFLLFNLLAFFMHQIFELTDSLYQECRRAFGSRRNLWDHLRSSIHILVFPDWETLLIRLLRPYLGYFRKDHHKKSYTSLRIIVLTTQDKKVNNLFAKYKEQKFFINYVTS